MTQTVADVPMTLAQQGIWLTERLERAGEVSGGPSTAYLLAVALTFRDPVEAKVLDDAWVAVARRHPPLAATVRDTDGEPRLALTDPAPVDHRTVATAALGSAIATELTVGFDLAFAKSPAHLPGPIQAPPAHLPGPIQAPPAHLPGPLHRDRSGPGPGAGPLARCVALRVDDGRTVALVVAHHLVFDGNSKDLLVADLVAAIAGRQLSAGSPAELSASVRAQTDRIAEAVPAAREFWSARPGPADEVILPGWSGSVGAGRGGGGRTPTVAEAATHLDLEWGDELDAALTAGAAALGATRFELLLAGVHALLARYGNATASVAVGLSTRRAETAGEIGMWVNELPVTLDVDPEASFAELVRAVRAEARAVYGHREVPLGHALPGVPPRPAMAPVSISYRRLAETSAAEETSATVDWLLAPATVRSALHLHLVDTPAGLTGRMHVPTRLLPVADAERIAGHLRILLAAALAEPARPVGDLDLLLPAEHALLERLNATARPRSATTVLDLVRTAAQATPDAVAVSDDDGTLTYRELVAAAHRIGHGLRRRRVAAGDVVGLCAHRGVELVAGVLGILAAGAAYLPLDPTYPAGRLELIATDAGAELILGHTSASAALGELPTELLPLDGMAAFAAEPETPPAATDPAGLAYVIYTSGSTGRPKGVEIGHAALLNLIAAMRELIGASPADRWLQLTTLSFDISGLELFAPLTTGARVVVATDAAAREGAALGRLIHDAGITHVQATPSSWQLLLDAGWAGAPITALSGGEPLPLPVAGRLRPLVDRLFNVYGPTETTIWSTAAEIPVDPARVTIGGPIANTTLHVLDARLRPVPLGVPGELCIGGAGLARAYRGRPDLTAERFVELVERTGRLSVEPVERTGRLSVEGVERTGRLSVEGVERTGPLSVADPAGQRRYRTGDRVRLSADGQVEFLGRADDQIKLRGHRIELGEIEQSLLGAPGVTEAAVAVRDGELVAYLAGAGELAPIRTHVAGSLPRYMIPSDYRWLDRLPRTPNGKLDRAALPAPDRTDVASPTTAVDGADTAGSADLTQIVTGIWREVLRVDEVAPDDTLFTLGGHSLTIMQITARIREVLGVEVPFDVFFDTPTIDGLVNAVEELQPEEPA